MFPFSVNPKKVQEMLRQLGMSQESLEAEEVVIRCPDKELVIRNPQVSKIDMKGQEMLQVSGKIEEREKSEAAEAAQISEDDIETVAAKTGASKAKAKAALAQAEGDLAKAILELTK